MKRLVSFALAGMAAAAFAAPVTIVDVSDIASVAARTNTVQGDLIAVGKELDRARLRTPDGFVVLVKSRRALERDNLLNDALAHFGDARVAVCPPESLLDTVTRLGGETVRPTSVIPESRWRADSWRRRCAEKQAEIAANADRVFDIVFLGDSITEDFEREGNIPPFAKFGGMGKSVWDEIARGYRILGLGTGGDRTQHLLWRELNGELDNYRARLFVLMIGSNNASGNTPEEIAAGVRADLDAVLERHPESKVLLYAILPERRDFNDPVRVKYRAANAIIRGFADGSRVIWRDINDRVMSADGSVAEEMLPDRVHPSPKCYRLWWDDIRPFAEAAKREPLDGRTVKPVKTAISRLVENDAKLAVVGRLLRTDEVVPRAPHLHGGRINHFAEIRRRLAAAGGEPDLVVFGMNAATELRFEGIRSVGIGVGETVEQVPWNALTGDFDGYRARWIAIGIDQSHDTRDAKTFEALRQTLEIVRRKQPKARVIVLAAAPGGRDADDEMRRYILRHNAWAKALCDGKGVVWCDYSEGFYLADGRLNPELMEREFRFTDRGMARLKAAILDTMAGRPPAFPTAPAPAYAAESFTLLHYNMHSGWGKDGADWNLWDPIAVIKRIAPDVCTLNEIAWGGAAKGFNVDQPTIMGHLLNPLWRTTLGKARVNEEGADYGNVILHRRPSLSEKVIALPAGDALYLEPRSFVAAEFPDYWVGTMHLAHGVQAQFESVRLISDWASRQRKPVFVTGDWNTGPGTETMRRMREHFTVLSDESQFTFPTMNPYVTGDFIAVDKAHADRVTVEAFAVLDEPEGSDHLPLAIRVSVKRLP